MGDSGRPEYLNKNDETKQLRTRFILVHISIPKLLFNVALGGVSVAVVTEVARQC